MMKMKLRLSAALLLCAGGLASAQSLSTGFNGTATLTGSPWNGQFFEIRTLNPITITSWDIDSNLSAGSSVDVRVYIKPGPYDPALHSSDPSLWTLLGEVATIAAGPGNPTPVPLGGLAIPADETWSIRIGGDPGRLRNKSATQVNANPVFANADLEIDLTNGRGQGTLWGSLGSGTRGWNGTIYYDIGNTGVSGSCCFPSGACSELVEIVCIAQDGTWHGAGTTCATTPVGGCPQPPTGACCLANGSCIVEWEVGCALQGGIYHGDGTDCATIPPGTCIHWLSTGFDGTQTVTGSEWNGQFFEIMALNPAGITIESWEVDSNLDVGTPLDVRVYIKPGPFSAPFHSQNPSLWTLAGEAPALSAGPGNPTPVALGGLAFPGGEVWSIRIGATPGALRNKSGAQVSANPIFADDDLLIDLSNGVGQGVLWGSLGTGTRGWNGTIYYNIGNTGSSGACCMPDGSCADVGELVCVAQTGTWHGGGTNCATTPPGGCPQPPVGACCLSDGSCITEWEGGCAAQSGIYQGDGSDCGTIPACPRWLTTSFDGTANAGQPGAGAFFNVTALSPQGISVDRFDIHSNQEAGTPLTVQVYARPDTYAGFEIDFGTWTLIGEAETFAAGIGHPTPVHFASPILHIGPGETWALRVGMVEGGMRYNTTATTIPVHENSDLRINLGRGQNSFFGSVTAADPTGWNGSLYYSLGANLATGACCLPDGTCIEARAVMCAVERGEYHGDGTMCATTPPGGCPLPPTGACCLPDATCAAMWAGQCAAADGTYQGDGTQCGAHPCPLVMKVPTSGAMPPSGQSGSNVGVMFDIMPNRDVSVSRIDVGLGISYGQETTVEIWTVEDSYLFHMLNPPPPQGTGPWVLHDTITQPSVGISARNPLQLSTPLQISAGGTMGVYLIVNTRLTYWTGPNLIPSSWSDGTMSIFSAHAPAARWSAFGPSTHVFGGWIHYDYACYANCDSSTISPVLNVEDFTCFINEFAGALQLPLEEQIPHYANCDRSATAPVLNVEDFTCFIAGFAQGCP
jgi:hypothetical protein